MAKNTAKPPRKYSLGDLRLIALLSEPIKRSTTTKKVDTSRVKQSEEYLRSIILSESLSNISISSSPPST